MDKSHFQADRLNPIQVHQLPDSWTELDLPLYSQTRTAEVAQTLGLLTMFGFGAGVVVFVGKAGGAGVIQAAFLVTIFCYYLGRAIRLRRLWQIGAFLWVIIAIGVYVHCRHYVLFQAVVATVGLSVFGFSFAKHYLLIATTAPLQIDEARTLRSLWSRKARCSAYVSLLLPVLIVAGMLTGQNIWQVGGSLLVFLVVIVLGLSRAFFSPIRSIRGMWGATCYWFSYDYLSKAHRLPGMFQSPLGWDARMLMTATAIGLVGLPIGTLSSVDGAIWLGQEIGALSSNPEFYLSPEERSEKEEEEKQRMGAFPPTNEEVREIQKRWWVDYRRWHIARFESMEQAERAYQAKKEQEQTALAEEYLEYFPWNMVYLFLATSVPVMILPTVLTFFVAFFVACPILAKAYSTATAPTSEDWFYHVVERLLRSNNPIERNSLFWGIVGDGSPILVSREAIGEHALLLGGAGSGKTTALTQLIEQLAIGCVDIDESEKGIRT